MKNAILKANVTVGGMMMSSMAFSQSKDVESWGTRATAFMTEIGAFKLLLVAVFGIMGLFIMGMSFWKLYQYFDTSARQQNNININQSIFGVFVGVVLMAISAGAALSSVSILGESADVTTSINNTYKAKAPGDG